MALFLTLGPTWGSQTYSILNRCFMVFWHHSRLAHNYCWNEFFLVCVCVFEKVWLARFDVTIAFFTQGVIQNKVWVQQRKIWFSRGLHLRIRRVWTRLWVESSFVKVIFQRPFVIPALMLKEWRILIPPAAVRWGTWKLCILRTLYCFWHRSWQNCIFQSPLMLISSETMVIEMEQHVLMQQYKLHKYIVTKEVWALLK